MKKVASGYRLIFGYLGIFLVVVGTILILPLALLVVPSYRGDGIYWMNFLIPGLSSIVAGLALFFILIGGKEKAQLGKHQDSVLLILVWVSAIIISGIPFFLIGRINGQTPDPNLMMNFTESIFESTSGYATVGLTRLKEGLYDTHIFTFYRAVLQFFGGVGLVLVVTSAISDRYGLKLYVAEGHNDKLIPNLSKSARIILTIYVGYILLGTLALGIAGVDWFDALCHSISSVATGGFSSKYGGMLALSGNMVAIEIITCILMFLGGTNFALHMLLLTGKFKKLGHDIEIRTFGIFFLILFPLFVLSFALSNNPLTGANYTVGQSFRYGFFAFMTGMTTTGYSNLPAGIALAPFGIIFLIVCTNVIGAGIGSTAGGAKLYRVGVAAKSYYWTLRKRLSNKRYIYPNYIWRFGERREISKDESSEAFGYIILYIIVLFVGSFLVCLLSHGEHDLSESLFEFSNALSSTGLSNGLTGSTPYLPVLWVLIAGMFAGRLEILAIYYAFFRVARDIFRKETV